MPIYEYECKKCGERFEQFRPIFGSDNSVKCPKCGTQKPKRLISRVNTSGLSCGPSSYTGGG